jgi:hypothetical protein
MGLQLHDYITGRRPWGQLERILERLPGHSYYKAALDDDDEFAALLSKYELPGTKNYRVPLAGYSDVVARLDNLYDVMSNVVEVLIAVNSKKGRSRQSQRAPRPENARDRLKRAAAEEKLTALENKLLGGG